MSDAELALLRMPADTRTSLVADFQRMDLVSFKDTL